MMANRSGMSPSQKRKHAAAGVALAVGCGLIIGGALAFTFPFLGFIVGVASCIFVATIYFSESL